ncbi:MAG: hypothetical protein MUD12_17205 [Spirochaetes bacterium]|jgi:hypothetical protein|nr:hypothetical protein [Spirochaetota bacterium]
MKKTFLIIQTVASVCLLSSSVFAFGIGFYGDFNYGKTFWNTETLIVDPVNEISYKKKSRIGLANLGYGGGIVLDSNVASDNLFNYRAELGFHYLTFPHNRGMNSYMASTVHYFGFGIVRNESIRFWVGPQVTLGALFPREARDMAGLIAGGGLAAGININMGETFTLAFTGAARYVGGIMFSFQKKGSSSTAYSGPTYGGPDGLVTVACIFRINDSYTSAEKKTSEEKKD